MKFKSMLLVCILLAILTMGVVSAEGDSDFNETLTAGIDEEVSVDASYDDEMISGESDDLAASSHSDVIGDDSDFDAIIYVDSRELHYSDQATDGFASVSVPEGVNARVIISSGERELMNKYVNDFQFSGYDEANEGYKWYGINIGYVNYFRDINDGDSFEIAVFDNQDNEVNSKEYVLHMTDEDSFIIESALAAEDFNCWISNHESIIHDSANICEVSFDYDAVHDGTLTLIIEKDGEKKEYARDIEEPESINWQLGDLEFIDEYGDYAISVIYGNEFGEINLVSDAILKIRRYSYNFIEGDIDINFPFHVIRAGNEYDEEVIFKILVNGEEKRSNDFWAALEDLDITAPGEYNITIQSFGEDDFFEEISYTINVDDSLDNLRVYYDNFGVINWQVYDPVLYLVCPDDQLNQHLTLYINDEYYTEFDTESLKNWTLSDLDIDENGDYDIRMYDDEDNEVAYARLAVWSLVSEENFNWQVSSHESKENDGANICEVWINNVFEGDLILSIETSEGVIETYEEPTDGSEYIRWELGDLDIINEFGIYKINLTYSDGVKEFFLVENKEFALTQLNYNFCEGEIYIDYPFDVIRFYPDDDEVIIEVYVGDNEIPYEAGGENPFRWILEDLGITAAGDYTITIKTSRDYETIDEFSYSLNVYDDTSGLIFFADQLGVESWELKGPVLYLFCPDDMIGQHLSLSVNNEEVDAFDADSKAWILNALGIDRNDDYDIRLFNEEGYEIASAWLNVNGIISEDIFHPWVASHEYINADGESWIVNIHFDGNMGQGSFNLTIVKDADGTTFNDVKTVDDANEDNDVIWTLDELRDILDEPGVYTINVLYTNGDDQFDLVTDAGFTLTQFEYNVVEGETYVGNPFEVIIIWDEELDVEVYVNGNPVETAEENPLRWTLNDLGIDEPGEYTIKIKASKDGEEEEFTYDLNVDNDTSYFRLISNNFGIQSWELDGPVLYLISPEEAIGHTATFYISDTYFDFNITSTFMNWTLEDLEIEENQGINIRIEYDGEEVANTYFDVWGFEELIGVDIWNEDEKGKLYSDEPASVVSVDVPEDKRFGEIIVIVNDKHEYSWSLDGDDGYHEWTLDDLKIKNEGEYNITVKRVVYDEDDQIESEDIIDEGTLNVYEFNNENFRIIFDKNNEIIRIFCYDEGTITIKVEREEEGEEEPILVNETEYPIENIGEWIEFSLDELGFAHDGNNYEFDVAVLDKFDEEACHIHEMYSVESVDPQVIGRGFYLDYKDTVVRVYVPNGNSGKLQIIVDGDTKYITNAYPDREYYWNFKTLNITETGEYKIVLKFNDETILEKTISVFEFENGTFRVKGHYDDENTPSFTIFCPEDGEGTIVVYVREDYGEREIVDTVEIPINDTYKGKWADLDIETEYDIGHDYYIEVEINGEPIDIEYENYFDDGVDFGIKFVDNDEDTGYFFDHELIFASIPYTRDIGNASITITAGNYSFTIKLSDMDGYEWTGYDYGFSMTEEDVDYFNALSDKDTVTFVFNHEMGKMTRWGCIQKDGEEFFLYDLSSWKGKLGTICAYGLEIIMEIATEGEDEDEEEGSSEVDRPYFAVITVPNSFNVTEGEISVVSGDKTLFSRSLSEFNRTFEYYVAGYEYCIFLDELNLDGINDKDIINVTLTSNGEVIEYQACIYRDGEENAVFHHYSDNLLFEVHYGDVANPEYGMDNHDGSFIRVTVPDIFDVPEGNIVIALDDGSVLFNKSLNSFENSSESYFVIDYDDFYQASTYTIMANESFYSILPENVNMTFSFVYGDNTIFYRGILKDGILHKIVTPTDINHLFEITVPENVLVNGSEFGITIKNIDANRQSIYIDVGGGYFAVYVNGEKIEDLGRVNRYDSETELMLNRLCSWGDGVNLLNIYLADLNITENGIYSIKVVHVPGDGEDIKIPAETEVFTKNVTLTSNVKANYENESVEWLTGYGVDPVLLYLDTYYGDINSTTGTITVLNSDNVTILTKNIKDLTYENGRYSLRYSNFTNKNFGDKITVKYSDGNERSGETNLDVLWKDLEPEDFNTTVTADLEDYYGNFINMNIPDVINTGQIIVTVKFKNNHTSNISNMDVSTDFDSQAYYIFNVADIKANYENGNFGLSLSDLEFYEVDGAYSVDVKFTGDGTSILDVANKTFDVALSDDVLITINETSRFGLELPFATVQIFEPMGAYAELYIDGVLYSHKTFEKGLITFMSSPKWAPGVHTAEIRVVNSQFEVILNQSATAFEVLTQSNGIEVTVPEIIKENALAYITFNAPVNGTLLIRVDNGKIELFEVHKGENLIRLGSLAYGNHTVWMLYNETLEDGSLAFYNNYLHIFAGDDGHWVDLPDPLVLNNDDTIRFDLGEDATGTISLYIDGVLYKVINLTNGTGEIKIDEEFFNATGKYGTHNYTIIYSGDDTHPELIRNGTFNVKYLFRDNIPDEGFPLSDIYIIVIVLPADAKNNVTVIINNVVYNCPVTDGQATLELTDLDMGEYNVDVSYLGDDKYPQSTYTKVLNVSYYGVVGYIKDGRRIVSLRLPGNATGNLTIYNDNMNSKLYTKALVNGRASFDLTDLPVGIYDLRAVYEGDDYDVKSYNDHFKVMPDVYITQDVLMDDDVTIFMDLDNSTGYILIVMDGLSPVLQEIADGKINYTFSTKGYSYGNHTVTFQYFGKSFDGEIFYEEDSTGKLVPIKYDLRILGREVNVNNASDSDNYLELRFSSDAKGTVEFFINGVKYAVVDIVDGIARLDISKFKNGKYLISWVYSGDSKYKSTKNDFYLTVSHKTAKIVASDFKTLYTANKKYSVKVYDAKGKLASGVSVKFLINNKAYKTVKTDKKGIASVAIAQKPGTYKITAKALGTSVTKKLTVNHLLTLKKVKVKASAKKLVIKVTLKKVNGKYLKGKKLTLKFNGKKFKAKTNKKGVAKFTVKSSVLKKLKAGKKVKYQATYKKDTVKQSVKVKK